MPNLEVQIEAVETILPNLVRVGGNTLYDMVENVDFVAVGEKSYRVPSQITNGWTAGAHDPDGGASITGSGATFNEMVGTFVNFMMAAQLTHKNIFINDGNAKKSLVDIFKLTMAAMAPEWAKFMEVQLHGDGSPFAVTATAHAVTGGFSVYTGDTIRGVRLLSRGCPVTVYDTTGVTVKATTYATKVEYTSNAVTLAVTVAGAAATDRIAYGHFSAANPLGVYGLEYWNSNASTGTTLGINRANEYEIRATGINVAGALTQDASLLLLDQVAVRSGDDGIDPTQWMGIVPPSQRSVIYASVVSMQRVDVTNGQNDRSLDRLPKGVHGKEFEWAGGIRHRWSAGQKSDRIDYIQWTKNMKRIEAKKLGFFEVDGRKVFAPYSTVNGLPLAANWFAVTASMNYINLIPREGGFLSGLTIPATYQTF
jgi:hypothetical protein